MIESEPVRYELRDIKKDKWRTSYGRNETILGTTVLANAGDKTEKVETVISYTYEKIIYWGTVEGVSRGLPTIVYENAKSSPVNLTYGWGSRLNESITDVRTIQPLYLLYIRQAKNCFISFAIQS